MLRFVALAAISFACFSVLAHAGAPKLPYDEAKNDAGYIQTKTNRHLFYWYFESRIAPESAPVVLWMSGGPGCR